VHLTESCVNEIYQQLIINAVCASQDISNIIIIHYEYMQGVSRVLNTTVGD